MKSAHESSLSHSNHLHRALRMIAPFWQPFESFRGLFSATFLLVVLSLSAPAALAQFAHLDGRDAPNARFSGGNEQVIRAPDVDHAFSGREQRVGGVGA